MNKLETLKKARSKGDLAKLLGVKPRTLDYIIYGVPAARKYTAFSIPKRSGGSRAILAPNKNLKMLQKKIAVLLQDCMEEIHREKIKSDARFKDNLSHGFVRNRSILTNAMMHLGKKNVLNIDLQDFFGSFNFGRVRGFLIKNRNFQINADVATVIAQIACHDNVLPQGSPCSPVISNLLAHALDIRLAFLAKRYSCVYTRYADDITMSTREAVFPETLMKYANGEYIAGKALRSEVERAGFCINSKKSRIQYKDSRQDVTGLVVNKKPNIKNEYWRTVKAQCHALFSTGKFAEVIGGHEVEGSIHKLEGKLNFIDQVDQYNRGREKPRANPEYQLSHHGIDTSKILSGREKTFSKFLYYKLFYAGDKPTILCEGKTDNIYLKAAIHMSANDYPVLAKPKTQGNPYELLVQFLEYSDRTRFLLQLYGGTSYLGFFVQNFVRRLNLYNAPGPLNPVIVILDNDSGCGDLLRKLENMTPSATAYPPGPLKNAEFIHVVRNLYVVLIPKINGKDESIIEDLFDSQTKAIKHNGKVFSASNKIDNQSEFGKEIFSKIVHDSKKSIDFRGFKPLLDRLVKVIGHYRQ